MTSQSQPRILLSTRGRLVGAIVATAFRFVFAVRGALGHDDGSGRLLIDSVFGLDGWSLIALNIVFYTLVCWIAFTFIRASSGKERIFMVGWFLGILLWPLRALPEWALARHSLSGIGLGVGLITLVSMLFESQDGATSSDEYAS